jgi:hypothetical protein
MSFKQGGRSIVSTREKNVVPDLLTSHEHRLIMSYGVTVMFMKMWCPGNVASVKLGDLSPAHALRYLHGTLNTALLNAVHFTALCIF